MTSRERMRAFYRGEKIDRIPNGLGGCETAGMHVLAYNRLKELLGVADPLARMYTFMTNTVFEPSVLEAMHGDMIVLNSWMCPSPLWGPQAQGRWKDQELWGRTFQVPATWEFERGQNGAVYWWAGGKQNQSSPRTCPPGGMYFDWPAATDPAELPDMDNQPSPDDFQPSHEIPQEQLREMEEAARWLYESTEYSITVGESISDLQYHPGGMQAWWMRMAIEPSACHDFLNKMTDAALAQLVQVHQAVGKYADAMILADDMGDRRGVTCGPNLWRAIYKPHYRRLWQGWKKITPMKSILHSCGSVVDILDDYIECGLDIYNPIQRSARGMDSRSLAARFGGRIIFYGGAYDAVITPPGTPEEVVYEDARQTISTLASTGRYIFAATHNIPGDTPTEHLRAMMRAYEDVKACLFAEPCADQLRPA